MNTWHVEVAGITDYDRSIDPNTSLVASSSAVDAVALLN
jgi:hypothetical protein